MSAQKYTDRAEEAMAKVVGAFRNGSILEFAKVAVLPSDKPSDRWSLMNRLIMLVSGTADARGFQQWRTVNRQVVKGAKAICILAPTLIKRESEDDSGKKQKRTVLIGFHHTAVFRYEDTEGEPLPATEPAAPPPLMDVAKAWDIDVQYGSMAWAYGSFGWRGEGEESRERIRLATHDATTYFHELSHAADRRVARSEGRELVKGQDAIQEVVAEFCAAVLATIYLPEAKLGFAYEYIEGYAKTLGKEKGEKVGVAEACIKVMSRAGKVLALVLSAEENVNRERQTVAA